VARATSEYRSESDVVGRFISECCVLGDWASARAKDLYQVYRNWVENSGEKEPISLTAFGRRLAEKGFLKSHDDKGVKYDGIGIRA
jgi:putative DNA primase/helicase